VDERVLDERLVDERVLDEREAECLVDEREAEGFVDEPRGGPAALGPKAQTTCGHSVGVTPAEP
jgi:hypothetical protein